MPPLISGIGTPPRSPGGWGRSRQAAEERLLYGRSEEVFVSACQWALCVSDEGEDGKGIGVDRRACFFSLQTSGRRAINRASGASVSPGGLQPRRHSLRSRLHLLATEGHTRQSGSHTSAAHLLDDI
ncbi:hypothetical protein EYF80_042319 [Liparis tanakae]|uniref:Uncharacterized protein n=1 Tax=Liparis tanakae TaxID=230148 RepID=A0A4Z2G1X1_9TELE|nr:hypothetical protein EYF80_042319 [Liparis tanakae]